MSKFMTQEMFDFCAVSAAKISAASEQTTEQVAVSIARNYKKTYEDRMLATDIERAANGVTNFIVEVLPAESIIGNLTQLQFSMKNFNLDGTKKRKKIFGGTLFVKEKNVIPNKVQNCLSNVAIYHTLVISGALPLAPRGWSP